ncbi:MAG: 16S rRNA (cytidine(1402)-2'-O)-methyltransferase [Candidatus Aphodocola sp.]
MGTLFIVATPIGNLNDFSKRAVETLKECDLILVEDTRQTIKLLNFFEIKKKMVSYHKFNEKERTMEIINDLKNGKNIALVSDAGTPCISDPGYILVKEARENDIKVIGIPGCSAVITALSIGGLDTSSFSFYGFVPTENKAKKQLFNEIKTSKVKTKVIYESPKRIIKTLSELSIDIPECVVSVCSELTKIHEKCIYGKIDEVIKKMKDDPNSSKGEYVILIENEPEIKKENNISLEAMIVDEMINKNCSVKEAINNINKKTDNISKKDIYNASLNLKDILKR